MKLASIRTIAEIKPNGRFGELAVVDGWQVSVRKGSFKEGDRVVYFETGAFLPEGRAVWQKLVDKAASEIDGVTGHVLKTVKVGSAISQGFIASVSAFPEIVAAMAADHTFSQSVNKPEEYLRVLALHAAGADVDWARVLGVIPAAPWDLPPQNRVQNLPHLFQYDTVFEKTDVPADQVRTEDLLMERSVVRDGEVYTIRRPTSLKTDRFEVIALPAGQRISVSAAGVQGQDPSLGQAIADNSGLSAAIMPEGHLVFEGVVSDGKFYVTEVYDPVGANFLSPAARYNTLAVASLLGVDDTVVAAPILFDGKVTEMPNRIANSPSDPTASARTALTFEELGISNLADLLALADKHSETARGLIFNCVNRDCSFFVSSNAWNLMFE